MLREEACIAVRGNVRTGRVSSEMRLVQLKWNAACWHVWVSAALCYTERLVSQQQTATGREEKEKEREKERKDTIYSGKNEVANTDWTTVPSAFMSSQVILSGTVFT